MKHSFSLGIVFCFFFSFFKLAPAVGDAWQAGTARVRITPDEPLLLSGKRQRDQPAEGTLHDLWAKALAIQDANGHRVVLITLDLVGIDRELSQGVCADLRETYSLERGQVALATSHTHNGPVVGAHLPNMFFPSAAQQGLIDRYARDLRKKLVAVVGEALAKVAPCRLAWGTGQVGFAINRRNNRYAEIGDRIASGSLVGPVDHDVPVLSVVDRQGELRAVVFGYACHPIWLRHFRVWSGDYPGVAQARLEQSHPEAMAFFWAGCGGDQNPVSRGAKLEREESRSPLLDESWKQLAIDEVEFLGDQLATAVESVLDAEPAFLGGSLDYAYRETEIPLAPLPQREELARTMRSTDRLAARLAGQALSDLDAGRAPRQSYPYPTQVWRLGDHFIVALGGETVVDYSLRLKRQLGAKTTWAAGYTNDVMAYIPSRRVLLEGGYEGGGAMVYYGFHSAWDPRIEEIIVQTVSEQVDQLRKNDGP